MAVSSIYNRSEGNDRIMEAFHRWKYDGIRSVVIMMMMVTMGQNRHDQHNRRHLQGEEDDEAGSKKSVHLLFCRRIPRTAWMRMTHFLTAVVVLLDGY
mmetsp:Transcript_60394/g.148195  ORF Transcript_60394/g.148195 Transcript_60394/m.148195 type:complete len:98 (-) Transcript_60394:57-350(-)